MKIPSAKAARWWAGAQRALMAGTIAPNVWTFARSEAGTLGWWLAVGIVTTLLALQVLLEWTRVGTSRILRDVRWDIAASTRDPMAAMAQMAYMDTLTNEQQAELMAWFSDPPMEIDAQDVPPVVAGMLRAAADPPRETT